MKNYRASILAAVLLCVPAIASAVPIAFSGDGIYDSGENLLIRTRRGTTPDPMTSFMGWRVDIQATGNLFFDAYMAVEQRVGTGFGPTAYYDLTEAFADFDDPSDPATAFLASGIAGGLRANTDYGVRLVIAYRGEGVLDLSTFRAFTIGGENPNAPGPVDSVALTDPAVVGNPNVAEPGVLALLALCLVGVLATRGRKLKNCQS